MGNGETEEGVLKETNGGVYEEGGVREDGEEDDRVVKGDFEEDIKETEDDFEEAWEGDIKDDGFEAKVNEKEVFVANLKDVSIVGNGDGRVLLIEEDEEILKGDVGEAKEVVEDIEEEVGQEDFRGVRGEGVEGANEELVKEHKEAVDGRGWANARDGFREDLVKGLKNIDRISEDSDVVVFFRRD